MDAVFPSFSSAKVSDDGGMWAMAVGSSSASTSFWVLTLATIVPTLLVSVSSQG